MVRGLEAAIKSDTLRAQLLAVTITLSSEMVRLLEDGVMVKIARFWNIQERQGQCIMRERPC